MAFDTGAVASCTLNGTDISEYVKSVKFSSKRDEKKCARIGNNQTVKIPGPVDPSFSLEGWGDAVINDIIAPLALSSPPTEVPIVVLMMTGSQFSATVKISNYDYTADSEEPQSWTCDCAPTGEVTYA
jgi:hypothetical protein